MSTLDRLMAQLSNPDENERLVALRELAANPGVPVLRTLRNTARGDPSAAVRAEALRLLGEAADRLSGTDLSPEELFGSARCERLLNDPDPGVRIQAVGALTMSFDARVPEVLLTALATEQDAGVVATLLQALNTAEDPALAARLTPFLAHADARVRAAAVEALSDTRDESVLGHLVPLLEDRHETVRVAAVRCLRRARQEAVLACVEQMLQRSEERDVRAALYVLRYFASAISVPRLAERLTGTPPAVAAMARASLASLARKGSKRARRALAALERPSAGPDSAPLSSSWTKKKVTELLESPAGDERLEATLEVIRSRNRDLLPRVRGRMDREDDPRVLAAMVTAVGRLGGTGDLALLAPYLAHKRSRVRAAAVKAVAALDPTAATMLLPGLRDRSSRVRAQAIVVMSSMKGINVMGSLRQMAQSADPRVVITAVWTAAKIRVDGARELLVSLEQHADEDVRAQAAQALGRPKRKGRDESVSLEAAGPPDEETTIIMEPVPAEEAPPELVAPATPAAPPAPRASTWMGVSGGTSASSPDPLDAADTSDASLLLEESKISGRVVEPGALRASPGAAAPPRMTAPPRAEAPATAPPPPAPALDAPPPTGPPPTAPPPTAPAAPSAPRATPRASERVPPVGRDPSGHGGVSARARADAAPPRVPPRVIAAGSVAVVAALVVVLWPQPAPPPPAPAPVASVAAPPPPRPSASASAAPVEEVKYAFAPMDLPAPGAPPAEPSLEEVERTIKLAHASRGITSQPIIHLMALDRVQSGYRAEIARAAEAAEAGQFDAALAILDAALEKLSADHLTGRVAVLRALVAIARDGQKFDRLAKYRVALQAEQTKLIELATEAAKDGGLRDHELKSLLARLKDAEKHRAEASRGGDWLSGGQLFEDKTADAGG